MSGNNVTIGRPAYPLAVSLSMIAAAIILSFVDLAFLNDVIGKVLDIGSSESLAIAFALGMVGVALMAHLGIKEAHGSVSLGTKIANYLLWLCLGIAFVAIRLFSAAIMQLDASVDTEPVIRVLDFLDIRQVDLVIAPLMLFLYIATGVLAKDGVKNLLINPDFANWWKARSEARKAAKSKENKLRDEAEKRMAKQKEEAEKKLRDREAQMEQSRIKSALNGSYSNALAQYRSKEKEIKEKYQQISSNIDYIKNIDKQEQDFETKVKPSLLRIVNDTIHSIQNNIALAIRNKTGEDITNFRKAIEIYNNHRRDHNR